LGAGLTGAIPPCLPANPGGTGGKRRINENSRTVELRRPPVCLPSSENATAPVPAQSSQVWVAQHAHVPALGFKRPGPRQEPSGPGREVAWWASTGLESRVPEARAVSGGLRRLSSALGATNDSRQNPSAAGHRPALLLAVLPPLRRGLNRDFVLSRALCFYGCLTGCTQGLAALAFCRLTSGSVSPCAARGDSVWLAGQSQARTLAGEPASCWAHCRSVHRSSLPLPRRGKDSTR